MAGSRNRGPFCDRTCEIHLCDFLCLLATAPRGRPRACGLPRGSVCPSIDLFLIVMNPRLCPRGPAAEELKLRGPRRAEIAYFEKARVLAVGVAARDVCGSGAPPYGYLNFYGVCIYRRMHTGLYLQFHGQPRPPACPRLKIRPRACTPACRPRPAGRVIFDCHFRKQLLNMIGKLV